MLHISSMMPFVGFVGNALRAKRIPKSLHTADAQLFAPLPSDKARSTAFLSVSKMSQKKYCFENWNLNKPPTEHRLHYGRTSAFLLNC